MRQLVTGGASFELEKSLAEGAGLRGGYSTAKSLEQRNRVRVEEIVLKDSALSRFAAHGQRFGDLFAAALREYGALCLGVYRLMEEDQDNASEAEVFSIMIMTHDNYNSCIRQGWCLGVQTTPPSYSPMTMSLLWCSGGG